MNQILFFGITNPFDIAYRKHKNTNPVRPHVHNGLEIYITLTDLPDALLGDIIVNVPAGSMIFIPPYMIHQLFHEPEPIYERYVLSIDPVWLENTLKNCPNPLPYLDSGSSAGIITIEGSDISKIINDLQKLIAIETKFTTEYYTHFFIMYEHIEKIVSDYHEANGLIPAAVSKSHETVNSIIRYINENLDHSIKVSEIADHFYMNKDYMERLFKRETHITLTQYISLQKVSLAQQYLNKGLNATQVGEMLGFCNHSHFSRFYKKMTGLPPGRYALKE